MWDHFIVSVMGSIIGGGIGAAIVDFIIDQWKARIAEIRGWKAEALSKLYGPLIMQFDRTKRAISRYRETDLFLEAEVLKKSNMRIRDLLLENAHYMPPSLLGNAGKLIEHYDVWLAEYERVRDSESPDLNTKFVFAGPQGYLFPGSSRAGLPRLFRETAERLIP